VRVTSVRSQRRRVFVDFAHRQTSPTAPWDFILFQMPIHRHVLLADFGHDSVFGVWPILAPYGRSDGYPRVASDSAIAFSSMDCCSNHCESGIAATEHTSSLSI